MKIKILIAIASSLMVILIAVRVIFMNKVEQFKRDIAIYESVLYRSFITTNEYKIKSLSYNVDLQREYLKNFDENKAIIIKDTTYTFLYLHKKLNYKSYSLKFIECLHYQCAVDVLNSRTIQDIRKKEMDFQKRFGSDFELWYPKFKEDKLIRKEVTDSDCLFFNPEIYELIVNDESWKEFDKFLYAYSNEYQDIAYDNNNVVTEFENIQKITRNQFNQATKSFFDNMIEEKKEQILSSQTITKEFHSDILGNIDYVLTQRIFDKSIFDNIVNEAFERQWRNNSLSNGSMPYAYCYGAYNYCSGWSCSEIRVKSGGYDVLTTIKDQYGDVIRHGYIKKGGTMTFNLVDGRYQVFFYSGTGWNPDKFMTNTTCGALKGGFVNDESFTKDNYISMSNQILTYELIYQQQGNFSPKHSSMSEAF